MTETIDQSIPAIERTLDLAATPERVWRALTDSAELSSWFGDRASLPATIGDDGWIEWDGAGRYAVRLEVLEPVRRVSWRWANEPGAPVDPSGNLVEWRLEPAPGGGTVLHLRESGFTTLKSRSGNVEGWLTELGELAASLAEEPWQRGIRRTWSFRSAPDRVWRAFSDPAEFAAWWGGTEPIEIREGFEGWFAWPTEGRFAMRIDRVEPPTYLAWRWAIDAGIAFDEADEILRTEWVIMPRDDGGTDVHLLESGFRGPRNHELNSRGWDTDVEPALRRVVEPALDRA